MVIKNVPCIYKKPNKLDFKEKKLNENERNGRLEFRGRTS